MNKGHTPWWVITLTFALALACFYLVSRVQHKECLEQGYSTTACDRAYNFVSCQ